VPDAVDQAGGRRAGQPQHRVVVFTEIARSRAAINVIASDLEAAAAGHAAAFPLVAD
jgi:hypothetical protein